MKLELLQHAGKIAGYSLVPENPAEESALKVLYDKEEFPVREYSGKILRFICADYALYDLKTLTKLGEVTTSEVVEEPDEYLICSECGSKNVVIEAWIYVNGGEYAREAGYGATKCEDCLCEVELITKKVKKKKGKKNK
jgi:hypothetical protein